MNIVTTDNKPKQDKPAMAFIKELERRKPDRDLLEEAKLSKEEYRLAKYAGQADKRVIGNLIILWCRDSKEANDAEFARDQYSHSPEIACYTDKHGV